MPAPRIVAATFATSNDHWPEAQSRLSQQLAEVGLVRKVVEFRESDVLELAAAIPRVTDLIAREGRGYGYWLWKPLVLRRVLAEHLETSEVALYLDVGCEVNRNPVAISRLRHRAAIASKSGVLAEQMKALEQVWTKRDLLDELRVGAVERATGQVSATWILAAPHQRTVDFLEQWIDLATREDFRFLDDSPSRTGEAESFVEHRHDQSIFSILYKRSEFPFLPSDGQWAGLGGTWRGADRPIWTVRNRGGETVLPDWMSRPLVGYAAAGANAGVSIAKRLTVSLHGRGARRLRKRAAPVSGY